MKCTNFATATNYEPESMARIGAIKHLLNYTHNKIINFKAISGLKLEIFVSWCFKHRQLQRVTSGLEKNAHPSIHKKVMKPQNSSKSQKLVMPKIKTKHTNIQQKFAKK